MALDLKKLKITSEQEVSQEQNQNPIENPVPEFSEQSLPPLTIDAPTHFDTLIENAPAEEISSGVVSGAKTLSADEFHKVFCLAFNMSSKMSGLKSLEVDEADGAAVACSSALYETCLEIPALHFLVQPQGKWGTRIIGIGAFAVPMAIAVTAEVKEKRLGQSGAVSGQSESGVINPAKVDWGS